MTDRIHQEIPIAAPATRVYEVLTDATRFAAMTGGAPTEIAAEPGGTFSCFGGMIHGRTVELVPGERVVQAWRVKTWPAGVYSIVRFELRPDGAATQVVLDHTGYPDGQGDHLAAGWHANYWEPMRKLLA